MLNFTLVFLCYEYQISGLWIGSNKHKTKKNDEENDDQSYVIPRVKKQNLLRTNAFSHYIFTHYFVGHIFPTKKKTHKIYFVHINR